MAKKLHKVNPLPKQPKLDVIAEFNKKRKSQAIVFIPVVLALILITVVSFIQGNPKTYIKDLPTANFIFATTTIIVVFAVFLLFNWRCPSCKNYLGYGTNPKFCSSCGIKIR